MAIDHSLLEDFFEEAEEHLETLEVEFIKLEKDPSSSSITESSARSLHTLKGSAGLVGLEQLEALIHQMESTLLAKNKEIDSEAVDLLLSGLDITRKYVDSLHEEGESAPFEGEDILSQLTARNESA